MKHRIIRYFLFLAILVIVFFQFGMKFNTMDSIVKLTTDNLLYPENIDRFLAKLKNADSGVCIIHIGDSHIQMGHFSGEVKVMLQERFGGKGSGLFFPNGLCGGYGPGHLKLNSSGNWSCDKISNPELVVPLGLTGMGIGTADTAASMSFTLKDKKASISSMQILHNPLAGNYTIAVPGAQISTVSFSAHSALTTITFDRSVETAAVQYMRQVTAKDSLLIYGISVNPETGAGIDYHSYGVSGGQFKYFAQNAQLLIEQLAVFKPDLLIISLGTNDSYVRTIEKADYKKMILSFVQQMKASSPETDFLFTTALDTKYKDEKPASLQTVNSCILEVAKETGCTVWDFYTIMGGDNSMQTWKKNHLSNKDQMHLNEAGYHLQAQLLTLALARAYDAKYAETSWSEVIQQQVSKKMGR
jgi:lysophospholipase L1-like esterase